MQSGHAGSRHSARGVAGLTLAMFGTRDCDAGVDRMSGGRGADFITGVDFGKSGNDFLAEGEIDSPLVDLFCGWVGH